MSLLGSWPGYVNFTEVIFRVCIKMARLDLLGGTPPKFEHHLRRHE